MVREGAGVEEAGRQLGALTSRLGSCRAGIGAVGLAVHPQPMPLRAYCGFTPPSSLFVSNATLRASFGLPGECSNQARWQDSEMAR